MVFFNAMKIGARTGNKTHDSDLADLGFFSFLVFVGLKEDAVF